MLQQVTRNLNHNKQAHRSFQIRKQEDLDW